MQPTSNPATRHQAAVPLPADGSATATSNQEETPQYLIFLQAEAFFAIGVITVKEIIQYRQLTTVPLMPGYIRGVINLRGAVIPVIDLSARFGYGVATVNKRSCIIILDLCQNGESHSIGILVDSVFAVLEIGHDSIEPPPAFGASVRSDFIAGMSKINGRFVILLDLAKTLPVDELAEI